MIIKSTGLANRKRGVGGWGGGETPTAAGKTKQTNQRKHQQQKQNSQPFKRTFLVKCWKEKGKCDLPAKEAMDRNDIFNSILYVRL